MTRALCIFVFAAACGNSSSGGSSSPRPPSITTNDGLVAFETVRTVLQHPRCQNCHPAGDAPLQGDEGLPHNQNVQRGPMGRGMVGEECTTCHRDANPPDSYGPHSPPGVANWHMPAPEQKLVFVGMTPHALCEQIKDPARNGNKDAAALRRHLDEPLVTWGWTPGFGRSPIPMPREKFLAAWDTWSAAGAPCP